MSLYLAAMPCAVNLAAAAEVVVVVVVVVAVLLVLQEPHRR